MGVDRGELDRRLERFREAARRAGVRLTHQRLEIFRELASSIEHPAAEAVFRAVQARISMVSLDTVYRTLWMLEDLGLITTPSDRAEESRVSTPTSGRTITSSASAVGLRETSGTPRSTPCVPPAP
jgi:Fur family transcriptional regulator, peroxide stress response regulator